MKRDFEHNIMVSESLILTGSTTMDFSSLLERNSSKTKKTKQSTNQNYFLLQRQKVQIPIKIQAWQFNTIEFAQ